MAHSYEQPPIDDVVRGEPFRVGDWIGMKNYRDAIHVGRNALRGAVHSQIDQLLPLLATHGGSCFFRTPIDGGEYRILVTTDSEITEGQGAVVIVNKEQPSQAGEPHFPDGRTLKLFDLAIPLTPKLKWMNASWEILHRGHHTHKWAKPEYATILIPRNEQLRLVGNVATEVLVPRPARDLRDVAFDTESLWNAHSALRFCNNSSFEPQITDITLK